MKYALLIITVVLASCSKEPTAYEYRIEGKKYAKEGKLEKALGSYNKALEINPNYDTVMLNIGVLYLRMKDYKQGENFLKKTIKINPKYDKAYLNLGILSKDPDTKLDYFKKGLQCARNTAVKWKLHKLIGHLLVEQNKYKAALESYSKALKIVPNDGKTEAICDTLRLKLFD